VMEAHPATDLFPLMGDEELLTLAADIGEHGLIHPVVLHEGKVLDGRNRLRACELAGVEPRYVEWEPNGTSPTAWVISTNLHRRHLTTGQRAALGVTLMPLLREEAKERQRQAGREHGRGMDSSGSMDPELSERPPARARDQAASLVDVSPASMERAEYLAKHAPEAFEAVKEGATTLNKAMVASGWEGRRAKEAGRDHPARPVARPEKTRAATEARRERIAEMAAQGYHEAAIAKEVGVGEGAVRAFMHDNGIPTLASRIGKRHRLDADRVMEGIVAAAAPSQTAIDALDWEALDQARIADWDQRLGVAIGALTRLRNRLRKATA
jgi:ParB-like chromosome segregation protein Spo0J